ncbi:MAG: hypothetical protein ABI667_01445 [Sphingomicrobium sp.]
MLATDMSGTTTRRLRIAGWTLALGLLALPAVAMQFTSEVTWTSEDFLFAGVMFATVGGLFELAARASRNLSYRMAILVAVACPFLQLWITLAVGIIGSEDNPANWTYLAMVLMAISVSLVALGKPRLMARAMLSMVGMQALFGFLHVIDGHFTLVIDFFFCALWYLSSQLFARAADHLDAAIEKLAPSP